MAYINDPGYEGTRRKADIGSDNNYGIDNDHDYRFRERHRDTDLPPGVIPGRHPFNAAFGTYMGNFGQTVYDPTYGIDSFGYHNEEYRHDRPAHEQANFRGRGPKNYVRSDERIREDVCERLTYDGAVDASDIEVTIHNSEIILSGTTPDRATKRRAADLVENIPGVTHVENHIRVRDNNADYKYPTATTSAGATNLNSKEEKDAE